MTLLERGALIDRLAGHLDDARNRGRLVLVAGEAGIGKTALVENFSRERVTGLTRGVRATASYQPDRSRRSPTWPP